MELFKKHAHEKQAKVLYAGVGFGNVDNEQNPILLNERYLLQYEGIQVVETPLN